MRHFRIQDSNSFLSASLSLTFGVMVSEIALVELQNSIIDHFAIAILLFV
jgi:hypothetical protein